MANRVRITLTGEGGDAEQALRGVENRLERVDRQANKTSREMRGLNRVSGSMTSSMQGLAGAAGIAAGAAGMGYLINQSLTAQEELLNLHKRTGVNIQRLQEFQFAARKSGVAQGQFNEAISEMSQRMGEAIADFERTGSITEMGEGFKSAGISMRELQQLNPTQTFDRLATAIQEAESEQAALNIAAKSFGDEQGRAMVTLFREGEKAIGEYIDQAHRLGIILDEDVVRKGAEAKKSITTLTAALESQSSRIVGNLAPAISELSDDMADWLEQNQKFLEQDLPQDIRDVANAATVAAREIGVLAESIGFVLSLPAKAGRGAAEFTSGSADSTERIINRYNVLKRQVDSITEGLENLPENSDIYENRAAKVQELRSEMELLESTMERLAEPEYAIQGADMWEQMAGSIEQTNEEGDEANDKARERIQVFDNEAASVNALTQRYEELRRAQATRDMAPQSIGPGNIAYEEQQAERGDRRAVATRDMAPPNVRFSEIYAKDDKEMLDKLEEDTEQTFDYMEEFSRQTAQNMQRNFSNFFYDSMTGELDSLSDYFSSFTDSLIRAWSDMQAKMLAKGLFGEGMMGGESSEMGGLLGAIGSGITSAIGSSSSSGGMSGPDLFKWSSGSATSYDTGGTLPEDIFGFGKSGSSYKMHQGETVVPESKQQGEAPPQINLTIMAADAKSFSDMVKRNPQAILGPIKEALNYGDMDLQSSIRSAS